LRVLDAAKKLADLVSVLVAGDCNDAEKCLEGSAHHVDFS
jgi:hypothetical protein